MSSATAWLQVSCAGLLLRNLVEGGHTPSWGAFDVGSLDISEGRDGVQVVGFDISDGAVERVDLAAGDS